MGYRIIHRGRGRPFGKRMLHNGIFKRRATRTTRTSAGTAQGASFDNSANLALAQKFAVRVASSIRFRWIGWLVLPIVLLVAAIVITSVVLVFNALRAILGYVLPKLVAVIGGLYIFNSISASIGLTVGGNLAHVTPVELLHFGITFIGSVAQFVSHIVEVMPIF